MHVGQSQRVHPAGKIPSLVLPIDVNQQSPSPQGHVSYDGDQQISRRRSISTRRMDLQSVRLAEHGINTSTKAKIRDAERKELQQERQQFINFVKTNFTGKECTYYCPDPKKKPQCYCGDLKENHYQPKQQLLTSESQMIMGEGLSNGDVPWKADKHIQVLKPTNAFGQIDFISEGVGSQTPTEFIRMSDRDTLDNLLDLMINYWNLMEPQKPSLCISVIGGAKNFKLEGRKKEIFHQGLIKAAQTTNAWLITSGLNLGIIRVVGDALQEGQAYHHDKKRMAHHLRCIGIAPWGYVLQNKRLISDDGNGSFPANYKVSNVIRSGQPVSLNQNHTHYIFVDDGYRRRYGGSKSAEFRAMLEKRIALSEDPNTGECGLGIPVVLVIVEGGHDVFIDCRNSIRERVPVVICSNTGRAADILAFVMRKSKFMQNVNGRKELIGRDRQDLEEMIGEVSGDKTKAAYDMVMEIVQDETLITVFDMNKSVDLDSAILYALLKRLGSRDMEQYKNQIHLALTWNRTDIAEEKIFKDDTVWDSGALDSLMVTALVDDKVDFVKLFLQNGVVMHEFLTVEVLHRLYNEKTRSGHFRTIMNHYVYKSHSKEPVDTYLSDVRVLLRRMMGKYKNALYDTDRKLTHKDTEETRELVMKSQKKMFPQPFKELFLWAVLNKRQAMAKFLWERTDEAIPMALAASQIYQATIKTLPAYDTETHELFDGYKAEFETLAVRVLEECNDINQDIAAYLIEKKYSTFGGLNCLELAASADDRKFLSSVVCQNSLDFSWCKGLRCHGLVVLLCIVVPPLIFSDRVVRIQGTKVGTCQKMGVFYSAPKTKFFINTISYLLFLCLYSYFILFGIEREILTGVEWAVLCYLAAMCVDEMREMFVSKSDTLYEKLRDWWNFSQWNKLDAFIMIASWTAALLRIGLESTFLYAKTFYCITAVFLWVRVFRLYSANPKLGPKLVMISRMVQELMYYILILVVALLAYGVTHQALLYPVRSFSPKELLGVFYYPYWQLYGEIWLEEAMAEKEGCNGTNTMTAAGEYCPQYHFLVPLFLVVYLLIGNILLLNLLIAIFSNIFQQVQENSLEIWKFKMYALVVEYEMKPFLPMPFVLLEDIVTFFIFLGKTCRSLKNKEPGTDDTDEDMPAEEEREIHNFEANCKSTYLASVRKSEKGAIDTRLNNMHKRLDELFKFVEDERQHFEYLHGVMGSDGKYVCPGEDSAPIHGRPQTEESTKRPLTADSSATSGAGSKVVRDHKPLEKVIEAEDKISTGKTADGNVRKWVGDSDRSLPRQDTQSLLDDIEQNDLSTADRDAEIKALAEAYDQRLQSVEERMQDVLTSVERTAESVAGRELLASGESRPQRDRSPRVTGGKKKLKTLETRLQVLEESTTRSLSNIERLLRNVFEPQDDAGQSPADRNI